MRDVNGRAAGHRTAAHLDPKSPQSARLHTREAHHKLGRRPCEMAETAGRLAKFPTWLFRLSKRDSCATARDCFSLRQRAPS